MISQLTDGKQEYHLQQALASALSKGGSDAKNNVPAPPADESTEIKYDELYAVHLEEPSTFIRFSQTVEECTGCQYNMTAEDDGWLTEYNSKKTGHQRCSEDDFEKIMEVYESTAEHHAPYAAVDNTPVVTFEVMEPTLKDEFGEKIRSYALDIYEWWKLSRENSGNTPLQPSLKFEMHQDSDDGDPYVCFRRRDVRQTRKTRARDVQSTEKLKRLRKELDAGRRLVELSLERERAKRDTIKIDKQVFEQRAAVKKIRQDKQIKADDMDLINQKVCFCSRPTFRKCTDISKPQKRKPLEVMGQMQRGPGTQLQLPRRPDGRPLDAELKTLADEKNKRDMEFKLEINRVEQQYKKLNKNYIDLTTAPLLPARDEATSSSFRLAATNYLLTPPQSRSDESNSSADRAGLFSEDYVDTQMMKYPLSPEAESPSRRAYSYRRRMGRGGRLWIDRRDFSRTQRIADDSAGDWAADRFKYDQDDDEMDVVYPTDPHSIEAIKFRVTSTYSNRRSQPELPAAVGQVSNGNAGSPVARHNPGQPAPGPS